MSDGNDICPIAIGQVADGSLPPARQWVITSLFLVLPISTMQPDHMALTAPRSFRLYFVAHAFAAAADGAADE